MTKQNPGSSAPVVSLSYDIDGAADELHVSQSFVKKEIARGRLDSIKVGRRRIITGRGLLKYIAEREAESAA